MNIGQLADLRCNPGAPLALLRRRVAGVPHEVGDPVSTPLLSNTKCVQLGGEGAPIDYLRGSSSSLMNSVIVLSVSAWGAVFIFLRSRSTSLSPVIDFVIVFPFRVVVRSKSAKISSGLCSVHPAKALAQLLCEKSRLPEGDEVDALL
jgi:hypothetical protein